MKISARSVLMGGAVTLTASAVAIAPSVQPPPPPRPAIQLAAAVQQQPLVPQQPPLLTVLLNSPLALLGPAAPIGTLPPTPAPIQFAIAPNLADTIDNIYLAVEPWVQYGFEVATSIVRWIPYVGWFAGQIMVFYNFGESIVASGVFNFTDWLRGNGGIVENLVDFGVDVGLAFVWLGLDELAQFVPLPPIPLPPRPPLQGAGPFLAADTLLAPTEAPLQAVTAGGLRGLLDRVMNPLDAGANPGDGSLGSLIKNGLADIGAKNGLADIGALLGGPLSSPEQAKKTDVNTIPSIVKTPFRPFDSFKGQVDPAIEMGTGPLSGVTKTVRNVPKEIRTNFNATNQSATGTNGVRAQGEVRNPVANAANGIVNAVRGVKPGKPGKPADNATKAPATVAKAIGDTVKKAVNDVRQTAKDSPRTTKKPSHAE
jgi:hypothetical protein